jgi:hypothetical protein
MVGPTGPSLLRDNPQEFRRMVRRRLVASAANERPFYGCADAAQELTGSVDVERAHLATAWSFVEYGGAAADRAAAGQPGQLSVDDLRITTRRLAELTAEAWPFVQGGYTRLVKPSANAQQAVHVVETPRPAVGHGLPGWRAHYRAVRRTARGFLVAVGSAANLGVYRTSDGGVTWMPESTDHADVAPFAERCPAGDLRSYVFALSDDESRWTVRSRGPDGPPHTSVLAPAELSVFAAACDEHALVAALRAEDSREVTGRLCPFRGACIPLQLPPYPGVGAGPRYPLDLARVEGAIVLSVRNHGVVRVTSSRDDGKTWTPYAVAFDQAEHPDLRAHIEVPDRLLALGSRLLLYGGAYRAGQTYFVLASDNAGASWRTP